MLICKRCSEHDIIELLDFVKIVWIWKLIKWSLNPGLCLCSKSLNMWEVAWRQQMSSEKRDNLAKWDKLKDSLLFSEEEEKKHWDGHRKAHNKKLIYKVVPCQSSAWDLLTLFRLDTEIFCNLREFPKIRFSTASASAAAIWAPSSLPQWVVVRSCGPCSLRFRFCFSFTIHNPGLP